MRIPTLAGYIAAAAFLVAGLGPTSATITKHALEFGPPDRVSMPKAIWEQAAGLRPSPVSPQAMQHMLSVISSRPRPHLKFPAGGSVGLWVSDEGWGYIMGMTANGKHEVRDIDVTANGCPFPIGLKVDHRRNLFVACEYNPSFQYGLVQEYAPGATTPTATFNDAICSGASVCSFTGNSIDVATDSTGHVFASNLFAENCPPSGGSCSGKPNVVYWDAHNPSNSPKIIYDKYLTRQVSYLDVDNSGNVYVDGYGCLGAEGSDCGWIVDEISDPTGPSPTVTNLVPPGSIRMAGGVYVSNGGTILNVTDEKACTITRYPLPFSSTALGQLGPMLPNALGYCDPIAGGFNRDDSKEASGDANGWLDVGVVSTNSYSIVASPDFSQSDGAAYTPSDK